MNRLVQLLVALLLVWLAVSMTGAAGPPALRSAHAQPTIEAVPPRVAITAEGKLFHDPKCTYIHGPAAIIDVEAAQKAGYTPCTRCLPHGLASH
jgi:hypothetical protein